MADDKRTTCARSAGSAAQSWRRRKRSTACTRDGRIVPRPLRIPDAGRRPYPDWLVHAQVPRCRYDDPDLTTFFRAGRPVVITDVPLTRPLVGKWNFDYLSEHYGGPNGLNVHFTPRSTTRFARFYGDGAGEGGILGMRFSQFVSAVRRNEAMTPPPFRHYMQSTLLHGRKGKCCKADKREIGGELRAGSETVDHAIFHDRIATDLASVDWDWLERMCVEGGCPGINEVNLWAGASGGCTPLHFDQTSNFLCQLCGRKRLLLFAPSQTAKLYPYPNNHPANAFGMVDVEKPDTATFPSFARAEGLEAIITPGDCLWMPSYVWHYVKQCEGDETLSLNFWVGAERDVRADRMYEAEKAGTIPSADQLAAFAASAHRDQPAMQQRGLDVDAADDALMAADADDGLLGMQMARHAEAEAINMAGDAAKAGGFLSAVAYGIDTRWPRDSAGVHAATQVRQHLITVLGAKRAAAVLRGMARDGRLHPGLAPKLGDVVVGTEEHHFSDRDAVRKWVRDGAAAGEVEKRKAALLSW